jgi:hypothetical protein
VAVEAAADEVKLEDGRAELEDDGTAKILAAKSRRVSEAGAMSPLTPLALLK